MNARTSERSRLCWGMCIGVTAAASPHLVLSRIHHGTSLRVSSGGQGGLYSSFRLLPTPPAASIPRMGRPSCIKRASGDATSAPPRCSLRTFTQDHTDRINVDAHRRSEEGASAESPMSPLEAWHMVPTHTVLPHDARMAPKIGCRRWPQNETYLPRYG